MKKIFAFVALFFAFASTSAIAKNDYSCDKDDFYSRRLDSNSDIYPYIEMSPTFPYQISLK